MFFKKRNDTRIFSNNGIEGTFGGGTTEVNNLRTNKIPTLGIGRGQMKTVAKLKLFAIHKIVIIKAANLTKMGAAKKHKGAGDPILSMIAVKKFVMSVKLGWMRMERRNKFVDKGQIVETKGPGENIRESGEKTT